MRGLVECHQTKQPRVEHGKVDRRLETAMEFLVIEPYSFLSFKGSQLGKLGALPSAGSPSLLKSYQKVLASIVRGKKSTSCLGRARGEETVNRSPLLWVSSKQTSWRKNLFAKERLETNGSHHRLESSATVLRKAWLPRTRQTL